MVVRDTSGKPRKKKTREEKKTEMDAIDVANARDEAKKSGKLSGLQSLEEEASFTGRQKEAAEAIQGSQTEGEEQLQGLEPSIIEQPSPVDALTGINSPAGQALQGGIGQELTPEQKEFLGTAIPAAGGALVGGLGAQAIIPSLTGGLSGFFSKFAGGTGNAVKTASILNAPAQAASSTSALKVSATSILAFSGLGSIKNITKNALTAKISRLEAEVSKSGEMLTKIPETSSLGFTLTEDGKLTEYTQAQALKDIEEVEQSLIEAQKAMKAAGIGQAVLKIEGKDTTAQLEIEKQLREIDAARGKVLSQFANPSEALINSRDFFRGMELEE